MVTHRFISIRQLQHKFFIIGICALILSACSNLTSVKRATISDWQTSDITTSTEFDSSGRLAIIDNGKGSYANFNWQSLRTMQTIEVNTPLGNSVGVLCRDQEGVIAEDSHGQIIKASNIEELSQRLLGISLPFDHLNQWVQGHWIAGETHKILANGSLQQSGWIIQRQMLKDSNTPRIVQLNNTRFKIKLVFDEYAEATTDSLAQCELRQKLS